MEISLKPFFDFLELKPVKLCGLILFSGALLFAPSALLDRIGLADFAKDYSVCVGLVFLFSVCRLAAEWFKPALCVFGRAAANWALGKAVVDKLESLSEDEKQILRPYVLKQTTSCVLRGDDPLVRGLESAGVIHRASERGTFKNEFVYEISELAWNHIQKNLLILRKDPPTSNGTDDGSN